MLDNFRNRKLFLLVIRTELDGNLESTSRDYANKELRNIYKKLNNYSFYEFSQAIINIFK